LPFGEVKAPMESVMRIFAVFLACSLVGCAATIPPVEVTRFHSSVPMTPAGIAIAPLGGGDPQGLEFRIYAAAVAKQLGTLGFAETSDAKPPYIVELDYSRGTRTDFAKRPPVTVGVGAGTGGGGIGIGLGTSFGIGGGGTRETVLTRLSVRIKTRADGKVIWEGRADTASPARAPAAQPGLAAEKLARGLFKDFPGVSGSTITVP
jgi:Domain of unknown function (DUF4136)